MMCSGCPRSGCCRAARRGSCRQRRDDGQFVAGKLVEQAGFADVRLADQHHLQAALQQLALAGAVEDDGQPLGEASEAAEGIGRFQIDLRRKISVASVSAQFGQLVDKLVDFLRELAPQTSATLRGAGGGGVDEVGDGLGLGQVEASPFRRRGA